MQITWQRDEGRASIVFSGEISSWDLGRLMIPPEHRALLDAPIETPSDFLALASMLFELEEKQNPRELSIEAGSAALDIVEPDPEPVRE